MNISIVIPVYNGENTLKELYDKIKNALTGILIYELIFVYDSGKDNSWKIITEIAENDPDHVRAFHFDKNYGQHSATFFGLKKASGDYIVTLDEDNQHDPGYIPEMIKKLEEEKLDFIYGKFSKIEQHFFRVFLSLILRRILCFLVPDLPCDYSSYRVIRKELVLRVIEKDSQLSFLDVELGRLSSNNGSLLIDHHKRLNGSSSYTITIYMKQSLEVLFGYSRLFRIIYNAFFAFILLGLFFVLYLILIHGIHLAIIAGTFTLILFIMLLIRINSSKRVSRRLNPLVIGQLGHNK